MIMCPSHGPLRFITSRSPLPCQKQSAWGGGCPITLHQSVAQNLSDIIWRSTFEIGAAQLRSAAEIAPKSPLLCVNRIWYGFSYRRRSYSVPNPIIGLRAGMFSPPNPLHWFVLSVQYPTRLQNSRFFFLFSKSLGCSLRVSHARSDEPQTLVISLPFFSLAPDLLFDRLRVHTDCFAN